MIDSTVALRALLATQRHSWEHGTAMQVLLETGHPEWVIPMAYACVYRQSEDGRPATIGILNAATDPCSVGEGLRFAAEQTGDPRLRGAWDQLKAWAISRAPRAADGTVFHHCDTREMWSDSFYMLPPCQAAAEKYDAALVQIEGLWRRLYDPASGLVAHRYDDATSTYPDPDHWGVGIGWTLQGLIRVQAMLPEAYAPQRRQLRQRISNLVQHLLPWMREDGSFGNVVDDPCSFPEFNLSQMLACTLYRGIREGFLDASLLPTARRLGDAVLAHVDAWGNLGAVCGAPDFNAPGFAPEAQAFLVLLLHERERSGIA